MMDTGYSRNFITVKKGRFNIIVDDDPITGIIDFNVFFSFLCCVFTPVISLGAGLLKSVYCVSQQQRVF